MSCIVGRLSRASGPSCARRSVLMLFAARNARVTSGPNSSPTFLYVCGLNPGACDGSLHSASPRTPVNVSVAENLLNVRSSPRAVVKYSFVKIRCSLLPLLLCTLLLLFAFQSPPCIIKTPGDGNCDGNCCCCCDDGGINLLLLLSLLLSTCLSFVVVCNGDGDDDINDDDNGCGCGDCDEDSDNGEEDDGDNDGDDEGRTIAATGSAAKRRWNRVRTLSEYFARTSAAKPYCLLHAGPSWFPRSRMTRGRDAPMSAGSHPGRGKEEWRSLSASKRTRTSTPHDPLST